MDEILFSVVIPAYNQGRWLAEALASVFAQGRQDIEVIVVDDGSTDETPSVVEEFASRVQVLRQDNAGVASARNRGIEASRGSWIAFLDADDSWRPGHLHRLARAIQSSPSAGLIFTDAMIVDQDGRELKPKLLPPLGLDPFRALILSNPVTTSAAAVRKAALLQTGGFDPRLKSAEDWDLWLRLARLFPVIHLPEISVNYRRQEAGLIHTRGLALREDTLKVMEKVARENPELPRSLLQQARANRYLESAIRLLAGREIKLARKELVSSLREYPWTGRVWLFLLASLGGDHLVQTAIKLRRRREETR